MANIKLFKEITKIQLFEGEVETTMALKELYEELKREDKFIMIGGKIIAKNQIKQCYTEKTDTVDSFILSQDEGLRIKLREKQSRLKKNLSKEMTLEYAQNFVQKAFNN